MKLDNGPMTSPLPDEHLTSLIDRIAAASLDGGQAGEDAHRALRALYDATSGRLYAVALRVVGHRDWAEDVLQETFLNVWRIAPQYRSTLSPPMAWLGLVARSRALDFLRRRAAERADSAQPLDDALAQALPGDSPDPMDTSQASEQAWALHECLRKLEPRQREVVGLAYFRDLSHSEVAQQLKLPLGTVKTWVRRSIDQLRGCLARFA